MTQNSINNTASSLTLGSATAYAVVCGGTSTTQPLQSIASVGTSGQVLTSNGASALPTFQSTPKMIVNMQTTTGALTGDGTGATVIFDTVVVDTASAYNASTGQYTIPSTGYYQISCQVQLKGMTAGTDDGIFAFVVGAFSRVPGQVLFNPYACMAQGAQLTYSPTLTGLFDLTSGDVLTVFLQVLNGTKVITVTGSGGTNMLSYWSIFKVS